MPHVQIRYADVPYNGKKVRLIRFVNEPQRPSGFFSGFGGHADESSLQEDSNSHLADAVQQEVRELFKADKIPLHFDSTEFVFSNEDEGAQGFNDAYFDDRDYQWHELTLKAHYN